MITLTLFESKRQIYVNPNSVVYVLVSNIEATRGATEIMTTAAKDPGLYVSEPPEMVLKLMELEK